MSKILLSYASEYDQGEGVHVARVLRRLGHDVVDVNAAANVRRTTTHGSAVRGYSAGITLDEVLAAHGGADLFLYVEPLGLIPRGLERSPIPTACILSDVHRNLSSRQRLARLFDHVFIYQRNYVERFTEHPPGAVRWLPYACDTDVVRDRRVARDLDVAFVGKLLGPNSSRQRVINGLAANYRLNEQRYYPQGELPEVYSRAKIVVNLPIAGDLNFRFFEALSCGAMLLTERVDNGQEALFQEGVHFAAFSHEAELYEKVAYYLAHEDERTAIAATGHREVTERHTLVQRMQTLLDRMQDEPARNAPARHMSHSEVLRTYATIYERSGSVETLLHLAAEQPSRWERLSLLSFGLKSFFRRAVLGW